MEELINQKPCVVQKIETPQGFSVSYKEHLLYSKYNPSKNIISFIEKLQLLPGSIILCFSPLLGYGLPELSRKLPENCLILLCEADKSLYDFSIAEGLANFSSQTIICCNPEKLGKLPLKLYEFAKSGLYKRVIRIDMSAGTQFNNDFYNKLYTACSDSVMTFWKNRITLTKFGRRYSKNLFENLHYLAATKAISDYFGKISKPIIVFGAGESTQLLLNDKNFNSEDFYILCADTALQPLLKNGIKVDGVFIEEAQSVITKAFIGLNNVPHIFAGLSSSPNIEHKFGPQQISYFFTEYAEGSFFDSLKTKTFMPPANKAFGSVGLTALYYALKFRKDESIPVYVCGLDFSYSIGSTHTKGALAHLMRLITGKRLQSLANYSAAFGTGSEKIIGKDGKELITTPTLKSYASMFTNFFADEKNLYDAGKSGIDLGLPKVDYFNSNASCPCESDTRSQFDREGPSNLQAKEIEEFLHNEKAALEELLSLFTGNSKLNKKEQLTRIRELAAPREYLYLHFADGWTFSTDQSFLNRIRTEIDFFLKYL